MQFEIEVNNKKIKAKRGETILEALRNHGISVPTLCHMKNHSPTGACRLCMVEVEGQPNLIPSCSHPVEEWMRIKTHSEHVVQARRTIVELLLSNHPDDCLFCERNGNCELQDLAEELNIRERRFSGKKNNHKKDIVDSCIVRDPAKCILCERCIRVCDEDMHISALDFIERGNKMTIGTAYNKGLNVKSCIRCGQCIMVCPTGALSEKSGVTRVLSSLHNPEKNSAIFIDPVVQLSVAKSFGIKNSKEVNQIIFSALHKIGFSHVYDTGAINDIYILKQAEELEKIIRSGESFEPILSSYCSSWKFHMDQNKITSLMSKIKSPQQLAGRLIKEHLKQTEGLEISNIFTVSVTPCTSRKYESSREAILSEDIAETDAVLTTRELIKLIRMHGISLQNIEGSNANEPFHIKSSASLLLGVPGGLSEAILRTLHFKLFGTEFASKKFVPLRASQDSSVIEIVFENRTYPFVSTCGMKSAIDYLEFIKTEKLKPLFIDLLACPSGCFGGGGQPIGKQHAGTKPCIKLVVDIDEKSSLTAAHKNPQALASIAKIDAENSFEEQLHIYNK